MLNFFYTLIFIALWTPVSQHLGDHDLTTAATRSYGIPTTVPDTAREALFSADANSRTNGGNINNYIEYYVQINGTNYTQLLHIQSSTALDGINTNSDNIWLPMPPNRRVYIRTSVAFPECWAGIRMIGYR